MIRLGFVLGIARAEARLTRRLVRFWVFASLSLIIGLGAYLQLYFLHRFISHLSASAAALNPRYFVANFGNNFLFLFLIGLVFLAFDVRARDKRERMSEVLDTLPCSNLELVLGKALGVFLPTWAVAIFCAGLVQTIGMLTGAPVEPRSLVTFVVFMAIPTYVFTIGLVYCLTLLLRHRLLAAIASLAVIVVAFFATLWWLPLYFAPAVDVTGGLTMQFPSDIVGQVISGENLVQRSAFFLAGLGLLWIAAAIHPRRDDGSRALRAATGAGILLVGAALAVGQIVQTGSMLDGRMAWKELHESRQHDPAPDVQSVRGDVRIGPGSNVEMQLELIFRAPGESALQTALFSLNPSMTIEKVSDATGGALTHEFSDGLLEVSLPAPLAPGDEATIRFELSGVPGPAFSYLDSAVDLLLVRPLDAQIGLLGYDPLIFDSRFVALMPGVRWLPASGAEIGRADPNVHPTDFYTVDLTVDLPEDWLVAGPGRRQDATGGDGGRVRYRFAPPSPVPDVALIAAPYVSYSTELEGVTLEALIHPSHLANMELFEPATGEIEEWLAEHLTSAEELGLFYPYDGLTLVEVPMSLRGYAGGWRMDTTLAQPGMILMRESSFPTARFDLAYGDAEDFKDQEGGQGRAQRDGLVRFFESDFNGGNPFLAASRSFFGFQTSGSGEAGVALDFVWEMLTTRLLTDRIGYFSVHIFDSKVGETFVAAGQQMQSPDRVADSFTEVMIHMLTSRAEVWETLLEVSLVEMDPWEDPERAINVLNLKGGAMAKSLLDRLGREKAGELLATLREMRTGRPYEREDVLEAGRAIGEDLDVWLATWVEGTALPGFVVEQVSTSRISDDEDGLPRYQTILTVSNDEETPGMLRVEYGAGDPDDSENGATDPIFIGANSAVEIGIVTSRTPRSLRAFPYLALNRDPFTVQLPTLDEERVTKAEPFIGWRATVSKRPDSQAIIVDDLDAGFSVRESESRGLLRIAGGSDSSEVLDQGLPVFNLARGRPTRWSRRSLTYAYGKYRHTTAVVRGGEGDRQAVFAVEIPRAGEWDLEFYVPRRPAAESSSRRGPSGTWNLLVVDTSGDREVEFDAAVAGSGWNTLGRFDLASGEVRVELSDRTEGRYVYADAIRWTPVRSEVAMRNLP